MSPLAEAMIVNMWLLKIDPRLPNHVKPTKSFLFTVDKPTLAYVQPQFAGMMDTLVAELDTESVASRISMDPLNNPLLAINRVSSDFNRQLNFQRQNNSVGRGRGFTAQRTPRYTAPRGGSSQRTTRRYRLCTKCYEAGRDESIYSSHDTASCYANSARVRYVTIPVEDWNDQDNYLEYDQADVNDPNQQQEGFISQLDINNLQRI